VGGWVAGGVLPRALHQPPSHLSGGGGGGGGGGVYLAPADLCIVPLTPFLRVVQAADTTINPSASPSPFAAGPFSHMFEDVVNEKRAEVRCAFSDRILHSRMPLDPTHVRLKRTCM
jgi:hypothetical protein